jgi:cytidine deaminase
MLAPLDEAMAERLRREALAARERAYAPYSRFEVGAAVLSQSGKVYLGQNVENASYGLSICAERSAIFAMVAAGERALRAVAIATDAAKPTAPCGACRQVIREFASGAVPDAHVLLVTVKGERSAHALRDLLPLDFGPQDLGKPEAGQKALP